MSKSTLKEDTVDQEFRKQIDKHVKELERIKPEIQHLLSTSSEYAGSYRSIRINILKSFSRVNGDHEKDLVQNFSVPPYNGPITIGDCSKYNGFPTPTWTKRVHFIRHGEGYHNIEPNQKKFTWHWEPLEECSTPHILEKHPDISYIDTLLTNEGELQAISLQDYIAHNCKKCTLLILSPMRRATQTGLLAFSKEMKDIEKTRTTPLRVVVNEDAHEKFSPHPSSLRTNLKELKTFFYETNAEKFGQILESADIDLDYSTKELKECDPFWDFGVTEETWLDCAKRGCKLLKWIRDIKDEEVAIVAHAGLLGAIFKSIAGYVDGAHFMFRNGEIRTCDIIYDEE